LFFALSSDTSGIHSFSLPELLLFGLGMAGSMLAGYGMALSGTRQLLHMLAFTLAITATVYVIMDLEYPRLGLIRIDAADQLLRDVLQGMK